MAKDIPALENAAAILTAAFIVKDQIESELSAAKRYFDCLDALRTVQDERDDKTKQEKSRKRK